MSKEGRLRRGKVYHEQGKDDMAEAQDYLDSIKSVEKPVEAVKSKGKK